MTIQTWLNFDPSMWPGEVNDEASMTEPDEVLTIKEMLVRHARGINPSSPHGEGNYYPEDLGYIPSVESMDLTEIQDFRDALTRRVADIKKQMSQQPDDQPNLPRGERPPEGPRSEPSSLTPQQKPVSEGDDVTT